MEPIFETGPRREASERALWSLYAVIVGPFAALAVLGAVANGVSTAIAHGYLESQFHVLAVELLLDRVTTELFSTLLLGVVLLFVPLLLMRARRSPWAALPFLYLVEAVFLGVRFIYSEDWQTSLVVNQLPVPVPVFLSREMRLVGIGAGTCAGFAVLAAVAVFRARGRAAPAWEPSRSLAAWCRRGLVTTVCVGTAALFLSRIATPALAERATKPVNVIWLTIDSVRADHLSAYGYPRPTTPNMDALAKEGVLFERAIAQHNWTRPSYASMFTGRPAWELDGGALGPAQVTLAEVLKRHGYHTVAYVQNPNLSAELAFNQGFDFYRRVTARAGASRMNGFVLDRIERLSEHEGPFFLFVHWFGPHWPYRLDNPHLPKFVASGEPAVTPARIRELMQHQASDWDPNALDAAKKVAYMRDLYDASLREADEALGEVLDALRRTGLLEKSLVVVNSDHGDEFGERGGFGHAHANAHPELTHIPFIVRFPDSFGLAPRRIPETVQGIDLAPTVLAALGIEAPVAMTGRSLLPLGEEPNEERIVLSQARDRLAVRKGSSTLMLDLESSERAFYDSARDPAERRKAGYSDEDPRHRDLVAHAEKWLSEFGPEAGARANKRELSADLVRRLRSLGYTE